MPDVLFEIGTEEIPARFLDGIENNFFDMVAAELKGNRIDYDKVDVKSTYRRIVVKVTNIAEVQSDLVSEVKGPPAKIAYSDNGEPTKAAKGFAGSQGVELEQLFVQDDYVYAQVHQKGKATESVLSDIMVKVLNNLYLPVAMRWGDNQQIFIRPVHWILFLFGDKVLPLSFAGVQASNKTKGHRIFSTRNDKGWAADLTVPAIDEYEDILEKEKVIVSAEKRKDIIKQRIVELAGETGVEPIISENLLTEVTYLTEYPTVLKAEFPERFLEVPQEVLIMTMEKNQKYFPSRRDNQLTNKYFIVAENANEKNSRNIVEGNNKVLVARLEDAAFFFKEDKKTSLERLVPKLKSIVFQEKLGTVYEKLERMSRIGLFLDESIFSSKYEKSLLTETIFLTKADLVTHMVNEFSDLQGIMGKKYALIEGKPQETAEAIYEHYLPKFSGDQLPSTDLGVICSVSDKIDSIVGCFSVGLIPTGSADPYALRRAAQGIVNIILGKELDIELKELINFVYKFFDDNNRDQVSDFFRQRIRTTFIDKGFTYDLVDGVLEIEQSNLNKVEKRLVVLSEKQKQPSFKEFVETAVRLKRISAKASVVEVEADLLQEKEEKELFENYQELKNSNESSREDWESIYKNLEDFIPYVSRFFDEVMVMAKDEKLRNNRLALVRSIYNEYEKLADFEKVVVS